MDLTDELVLASIPPLDSRVIARARDAANVERMRRFLPVIVLVNLVHIAWFAFVVPRDSVMDTWRRAVMGIHGGMAVFGLAVLVGVVRAARRPEATLRVAIALCTLLYPAFGALLAGVDQLVTTSVTPLFVTGIGVALALHPAPRLTHVTYPTQLVLALLLFARYQTDVAARTSNIVNAVSICALGWIVARHGERAWRTGVEHRHTIGAQAIRLREANAELSELARTDSLTGLMNRRALLERAERFLEEPSSGSGTTFVLALDVDHFKRVNDEHGHAAGDDVLRAIVDRARGVIRTDDLFARLGGEEFAIVLSRTTLAHATRLAEAIRTAIAEAPIPVGTHRIGVTASIGIAAVDPSTDENLQGPLARADAALYQAKREGRDRVVVFRDGGP